jgi:hypothetical protein
MHIVETSDLYQRYIVKKMIASDYKNEFCAMSAFSILGNFDQTNKKEAEASFFSYNKVVF